MLHLVSPCSEAGSKDAPTTASWRQPLDHAVLARDVLTAYSQFPTAHWTANSYKRHNEFDDTTYVASTITACVRCATQNMLCLHVHPRRAVTNTKKGHTKQHPL